jgi:hypothetical protein
MKWNELSKTKKLAFVLLVAVFVIVSPEFAIFLNFGGMELAVGLLLINLVAIKGRLAGYYYRSKTECELIVSIVASTYLARERVFFLNSGIALAVLLISCSSLMSVGIFMMPAMFPDGQLPFS